jgi:hypothetical protein
VHMHEIDAEVTRKQKKAEIGAEKNAITFNLSVSKQVKGIDLSIAGSA